MTIKRSVSMYSLQDAYAYRRLDLGGVLRFVTDLGAGVELISDQMIKGAPHPSEATLTSPRLRRMASQSISGLPP